MPEPVPVVPIINGHYYSFASLEVKIADVFVIALKSINYGSSLTPGKVRGSDPEVVGRTPGVLEHTCDFEVYRHQWEVLRDTLGQSYGRKVFDVIVTYAEADDVGVTTDRITGCRIVRADFANADGTEATVVKVTCDPTDIRQGAHGYSIEELYPVIDIFETEE